MNNKKAYIIRTIFWSFITILLLASGIIGLIYNNEIFNTRKDELNSIIKIFENSKIIKNYESIAAKITAELKGKNISITYNGAKKETYSFKLKNGYLETNIEKNDSIGRIIVMVLTDSIAINKGRPEESTYIVFNDENILKYKLNDGIEYKLKNNNTYNIKINLDKYLINKYTINIENENNENNLPNENENDNIN